MPRGSGRQWRESQRFLDFFQHLAGAGATMGSMARRKIPEYFLDGESSPDVDARFLHVESIAERSRLHDWNIRPHAHRDLLHLLLVTQGGGRFHAEGNTQEFVRPAL